MVLIETLDMTGQGFWAHSGPLLPPEYIFSWVQVCRWAFFCWTSNRAVWFFPAVVFSLLGHDTEVNKINRASHCSFPLWTSRLILIFIFLYQNHWLWGETHCSHKCTVWYSCIAVIREREALHSILTVISTWLSSNALIMHSFYTDCIKTWHSYFY